MKPNWIGVAMTGVFTTAALVAYFLGAADLALTFGAAAVAGAVVPTIAKARQ